MFAMHNTLYYNSFSLRKEIERQNYQKATFLGQIMPETFHLMPAHSFVNYAAIELCQSLIFKASLAEPSAWFLLRSPQ